MNGKEMPAVCAAPVEDNCDFRD